jgi:hypothetical protein
MKKKIPEVVWIGGAIAAGVVLFAGLVAVGLLTWNTPTHHARPPSTEAVEDVSVAQVMADYEGNDLHGDAIYKGKRVRVTGVVLKVSGDGVLLGAGREFEITGVMCRFDYSQRRRLVNLAPGEVVTVTGRCRGKSIDVILDDCSF